MKKILVIENNLLLKENLIDLLQLEGFHVTAVKSICQGLLLIQQRTPDVVIYDVEMLQTSDFTNLQREEEYFMLEILRRQTAKANLTLILLADTSYICPQLALLANMTYLGKPFKISELLAAINASQIQKKSIEQIAMC